MKKLLSLLLVGVMSVMLLAGCGTTGGGQDNPDSGSDETEKSISIAQSANFSMGFAPGVQSYETTYYMNNFYESLVEYRDGEYQPCLATDWTVSEDGLTYTFYLREDVQFNDGTAFNAEAVKLYFDNMKSVIGTSANYGQLDMLTTEITVDDEYTVSFHLSRPYYNVLNDLAMVMPRGILSAAAFNDDGSLNTEYLMTHTPGTGPYMFESVNETATEYTFVKNPNYWGEEPDVDRFTVKVIPESKVAAMRSGEVDFIIGSDTLDANSYQELSQTEGITGIISDFNFVTEFIALNDEIAPLDDQNVRTAIQMAIDKESIAQNIYTQSENQYLIHELNGMKKRLLSFEEFAKDAQPEALFTLVHSIVDRIYITTDGTKQKCQVYIKGCATEDYSDVLGAAGYIEEEPLLPVVSYMLPMCDLDYYSIPERSVYISTIVS